jgi:hypothetical protein
MAGRSWPSLTSDVLEHEWIGVHQLRLHRKRRRRAHHHPVDLIDYTEITTRPIRPRECADAPPFVSPSCAPRTALVHRSVAAAEYITDPMMQLITSGNDQSESTSGPFIPIRG